ncbi:MAG: hypothetical protein ACSLFK_10900 [Gemmatimonadaceae bacterium]
MPRKPIAVRKKYAVGADQVRLSVLVGDRQFGTSMVFLDDELLANGDIDELPLGAGDEIAGRTVTVYTVVTDVRDKKNDMSVTWILTGGNKTATVEKSGSGAKSFGSQMFKAVFDLSGDA